ncbi:MAG: flagellar filament capping protein FliD [Candidatus Aureabacteria bacterium]|nr:flagellar filament capping protein FliD [Candidatus Auribacterota bacterium]
MAFETTTFFEIEETVNQLIAIERQPLDTLIERRDSLEKQKIIYDLLDSTLETLQASLDTLRKQAAFESRKVNISDTSVIKASSAVGASEIYYDIVVSGVAQAARVQSDAVLNLDDGTKEKITGNDVKAAGSVNANAAINSGLGLDNGEITAGEFIINDITIEVINSDTINTILSKITSSSANVLAYYDEDNDRIILEQKTAGVNYDIELGSDSTNFFNAMKVTSGTRADFTDGVDKDIYRTLDDLIGEGKLGGGVDPITTGYFTINNVTFFVDTSVDTLFTVMSRINSSAANVSLFYDATLDKVVLTSDVEGEDLELRNDSTSKFLNNLDILDATGDQDGTGGRSRYEGTSATVHVNGSELNPTSNQFTILGTTFNIVGLGSSKVDVVNNDDYMKDKLTNFVDQFNNTLTFIEEKRDNELSGDSTLFFLYNSLINKVQSSISNNGNFTNLSRIGIKMGTGTEGNRLTFDTNTLDEALLTDRESVMKLFAYDSDSDGLYDDGGLANDMYSYLRNYTRAGLGIIYKKNDTIDDRVEQMDISIRRKEEAIEKKRIDLTEQFVALNKALQMMEQRIQSLNSSLQFSLSLISGQYLL